MEEGRKEGKGSRDSIDTKVSLIWQGDCYVVAEDGRWLLLPRHMLTAEQYLSSIDCTKLASRQDSFVLSSIVIDCVIQQHFK